MNAEITHRTKSGLSAGYKCFCGLKHDFPSYVFAHWRDAIRHTCDCGRVNSIHAGDVYTPKRIIKPKAEQH